MVGDCCSIGEIEYRLDTGGKLFIGNCFGFMSQIFALIHIFVDVPSILASCRFLVSMKGIFVEVHSIDALH